MKVLLRSKNGHTRIIQVDGSEDIGIIICDGRSYRFDGMPRREPVFEEVQSVDVGDGYRLEPTPFYTPAQKINRILKLIEPIVNPVSEEVTKHQLGQFLVDVHEVVQPGRALRHSKPDDEPFDLYRYEDHEGDTVEIVQLRVVHAVRELPTGSYVLEDGDIVDMTGYSRTLNGAWHEFMLRKLAIIRSATRQIERAQMAMDYLTVMKL